MERLFNAIPLSKLKSAWWRTTSARYKSTHTMLAGGKPREPPGTTIRHEPTNALARAAGLGVFDVSAVSTAGLFMHRAAYVQNEKHPLHFVCSPYREFDLLLLHLLCADLG